jgi:hypothetical protein
MVSEYNFPDHISGTTFGGVQFTVTVNGVPLNLSGATISIVFNNGQYTLSTTNGGLSITSPFLGRFVVNNQIINWKKDRYRYYITFTLGSGVVKRYVEGFWRIE